MQITRIIVRAKLKMQNTNFDFLKSASISGNLRPSIQDHHGAFMGSSIIVDSARGSASKDKGRSL